MKEIEFKDKISDTITINIKLSNKINVIDGDSGTGKTFIYEMLKKNKVVDTRCINKETIDSWEISGNPVEDFKDMLRNNKDTLFIIDRADEIFAEYPEILKTICFDKSSNTFLLFTRETIFVQNIRTWHTIEYDKSSNKVIIKPVV